MNKVYRFTASWCSPCKIVAKILDDVMQSYPEVSYLVIDIDDNPDLVAQFGVRNVPTVILLNDAEEKTRFVGAQPKSIYQAALDHL